MNVLYRCSATLIRSSLLEMGLAELQVVHVPPTICQNQKSRVKDYEDSPCSLIELADAGWSMFVVLPLVVGQWRGTWELMSYYTPEHQYERGLWWCLWLGSGLGILFTLLRKPLSRVANSAHLTLPQRLAFIILSRVYVAIFASACIAQWRGTWYLIDLHCGTTYQLALFSIGLGTATLARLKCVRNLSGPPFMVVMDLKHNTFTFPTRFRTSGSKDPALHTLDCVFSVMVVGSLVVIVWRGTWGILDHVLLPQDPALSAWVSLGIGYGVTAAGFALQVPARVSCEKLSGAPRLIVADTYQFLCFCGTVNLWRGVWNLLNIYLLPESPLASYWLTHWACLLLLMVLCCGNSLLVRGVFIDGEEEGGQCVVFQCNYLRHRYQEKSKEQQAAQAAAQAALLEKRNKTEVEPARIMDNNIHVTLMAHDTLL